MSVIIVNTDTLKIYHILNNSNQNNDELNFNVNRKYAILNNGAANVDTRLRF